MDVESTRDDDGPAIFFGGTAPLVVVAAVVVVGIRRDDRLRDGDLVISEGSVPGVQSNFSTATAADDNGNSKGVERRVGPWLEERRDGRLRDADLGVSKTDDGSRAGTLSSKCWTSVDDALAT